MKRSNSHRRGWTLLELMVVVTLIAMLSAMATFNFKGPFKRTQFESSIQQFKLADHSIRRSCLQTNQPGSLSIQPGENRFRLVTPIQSKTREMPPEVEILHWLDGQGQAHSDSVEIPFGAQGQSRTYGICLGLGERKVWLVFLGQTGEIFETENQNEATQFFNSIRTIGNDAY